MASNDSDGESANRGDDGTVVELRRISLAHVVSSQLEFVRAHDEACRAAGVLKAKASGEETRLSNLTRAAKAQASKVKGVSGSGSKEHALLDRLNAQARPALHLCNVFAIRLRHVLTTRRQLASPHALGLRAV